MNKNDAVQWLGNRGFDIEVSDIIRCGSYKDHLFLHQKDYPKEVEMYCLLDMYGECIDGFNAKTFEWNQAYLKKKVEEVK